MLSGVIYIGFKFITMKSYELAVAKQVKEQSPELYEDLSLKQIVKQLHFRLNSVQLFLLHDDIDQL